MTEHLTPTGINFDRIATVFCCANNKRVPDLYAAAFNIMMNVSGGDFTICLNETATEETLERFDMLQMLARRTENVLTIHQFPPEFSKAKMISKVMFQNQRIGAEGRHRQWHLNVDDDFMIPYKTLSLLAQASRDENWDSAMYIYGLFDVINFRAYEDWSAKKLKQEDLFQFIAKNGMRCLNNHLCADIPDEVVRYEIPGQSTGSYMVSLNSLRKDWEDVKEVLNSWPKGKRGYDDFLCRTMAKMGKVYWLYGSNNFHTDLTKHHVDGVIWTEDVFRDDNMLDGSGAGRIPVSEVGEKSIPRDVRPENAPYIPGAKEDQ